jgi:hypothetical protein
MAEEEFEGDDIDEEMEEVENEKKEATKPKTKAANKQEPQAQVKGERYQAIHQPEAIVLVDNVKGIIIADKIKDEGLAIILADIENKLDRIITSLG